LKTILAKIFTILNHKEKQRFYSLVALNLFISIADITFLALLLFIIAFYTQNNVGQYLSFLPGWLSDKNSFSLVIVFFLLFTIKSVIGYLLYHAQYRFVYSVASRISANNLLNYLEGKYSDYVTVSPAAYNRHIADYPIQFGQYILFGLQQIITETTLVCFSIIGILLFNATLFLLLLFALLPPVLIVVYFSRRRLKAAREHAKKTSEVSLQYLHEALAGFVESNIYDKNHFFTDRYAMKQRKMNSYLSDIQITQGLPTRLIEVFAILGLSILIIANKTASTPIAGEIINIGAFMIAAYKLIPGIVKISNVAAHIKTYEYTINDLVKEVKPEVKAAEGQKLFSVAFNAVSFSHSARVSIADLNFKINKGDIIGISGHSGKGKTTIINLLLGFLRADKGDILINEKIVLSNELPQYWNDIAYVKQQSFLIHDTLLKNITLEDNYDNARLQEAVHASGLDQLMNSSTDDLNKIISDNGKNISGGQRQRIAIARALYKNANLIILDEPFNELDNASEQLLLTHFKQLALQGKMIILISHDKNSLSYCSKIISLDAQ